ncbi:hypothetical protein DU002_05100 [Corallincola holothuriorum]|uniref:Uncharacterized protein n=1 Tax=Corallincola holothuriorum TaxID=2282215 RepID=A0A368NN60_9GAMM|nr:hypothetical protein DU002_05100 [Corallincola holothuriorum]
MLAAVRELTPCVYFPVAESAERAWKERVKWPYLFAKIDYSATQQYCDRASHIILFLSNFWSKFSFRSTLNCVACAVSWRIEHALTFTTFYLLFAVITRGWILGVSSKSGNQLRVSKRVCAAVLFLYVGVGIFDEAAKYTANI